MIEKKIELPGDVSFKGLSLAETIERRRSERHFSGESLPLIELSRLLYYAMGVTERRHGLRAAPSAGALYPIEMYPIVNGVEGLERGIYHYLVEDHSLELVKEGDFRAELSRYALGQRMTEQANVALVLTAVSERIAWRYGDRASRYTALEAGHISQNIYLTATSLGLGACAIGAFTDKGFNRLLGIDGDKESTLYITIVGKIRD